MYIVKADLKDYQGITLADDDTLIDALIGAAQKFIESYTGRVFEVTADTIRYQDADRQVVGETLYLDDDLCYIKTITNNADAVSPDVLTASDYVTRPRNHAPYWAIKLTSQSGKYWHYTYDPENGIKIEGKWGYSVTPSDDIKQACKRLVGYYYQLRNAQVFDVTADIGTGTMVIPKGLPQDIKFLLDPYRKLI